MSTAERVAVVVVHGIADQLPGQTVREVAGLLCRGGAGAPPYEQGERVDVLVPVEKLEPGAALPKDEAAPRRQPGAPSGFFQAQETKRAAPASQDLGMALNDYLLGRLVLPQDDALYESTRVTLRRRGDERSVDLYEMYWADLSRLGAGGLQALSSMYQMFFHLSTLAADVVDQVSLSAKGGAAWRLLQRFHAWLAWLMKGPTALLQLGLLLMVGFGTAALVPRDMQGQLLGATFGLAAIVLAALAGVAFLRARGVSRYAKLVLLLAAAALSFTTALFALIDEAWVARLYFAASALGVALAGWYVVERYARVAEGVRVLGRLVVLASVGALCVEGMRFRPQATTQIEWMLAPALHVAEWLLAGVMVAFAAFVAVQIGAILLGVLLGRGCDRAGRASLHTARLFLIGSSSLFAVLSLVLWSVVSFVAGRALSDFSYAPVLLGRGYRSAEIFMEERVQMLGGFFTPLVFALVLVVAAALVVLLPSLIEEISPTSNVDAKGVRIGAAEWARRLGNWLTRGVRAFGTAFKALLPAGAIAGSILYLAFVLQQLAFATGGGGDLTAWLFELVDLLQGETLVAAGKWLAGGALTIAALGSRFTRTFGRLRVALDAVLDVDNYFADPPNRKPPRARIYSRYASLLAHVRRNGYARIVIAAHSQGSVISAELLRYLHAHGRLRGLVGELPVALVTVGSPLRNLYAERFPLLYRWMGSREGGFAAATPAAAEVGATEWVNAYRSGDYVGRFIWTPDQDPELFDIGKARRAGDRSEFCLGAGAHTHYFSEDAVALAAEIERLVAGAAPN
jgi:hypothetical protein